MDFRLNPVVKNESDYRLFVVHMLPKLRQLGRRSVLAPPPWSPGWCSVRWTDRTADFSEKEGCFLLFRHESPCHGMGLVGELPGKVTGSPWPHIILGEAESTGMGWTARSHSGFTF